MDIAVKVVSTDDLVKKVIEDADRFLDEEGNYNGMDDENIINKEETERKLFESSLSAHIKKAFEDNRIAREASLINDLMLDSLRAYNGEYSAEDIAKINAPIQ